MIKNMSIILGILTVIWFGTLCASQTFPRDSISHYALILAACLSGGYVGWFIICKVKA